MPGFLVPAVDLGQLLVERQEIVQDTDKKQAAGAQVDDAGNELAHVEAVDAEKP